MKHWRIHLVWAAVTVVGGAALGQFLASRQAREASPTETELASRIARLKARVAELEEERSPRTADPTDRSTPPATAVAVEVGPDPAGKKKKDPEAPLTPDQILALLKGKDPSSALKAIDGIADRAQKLALLRQALAHPDEKVRREALKQVGALGGPEASQIALAVFQSDESPRVRSQAAGILGDLGSTEAIPSLQSAFRDAEGGLQLTLAISLRKLGDPGPHEALIYKAGEGLKDPDGGLRRGSVETLRRLGTPLTFPYLQRAMSDSNSDVRLEVVDAFKESGSPEAIPYLERMLTDRNPEVVKDAQSAIQRLKNPEAKKKK